MNEMPPNPIPPSDDDLQTEYHFDYCKAKPNRFATGNNVEKLKVVVLDDDVAQVFTTPEAVNKALKALIEAMPHRKHSKQPNAENRYHVIPRTRPRQERL